MIQKQNHIKEEVHIEIEAKKYKPNVTARVRKKKSRPHYHQKLQKRQVD